MHPLGYLLDLRRARTSYRQQALGLSALFAVPCFALTAINPDAGARFLIIAAVGMVLVLPVYQARSQLSLLSSLRRSHCLEELLGCGLPAQSCADQLARHAVRELLWLTLPVLAVLVPGALLAGPEMRAYLLGLGLWLPVMIYLTALGSYAAFVQMAWAGGWRRKARLAGRCWPLLVAPVFLLVSNGGPLATLVALSLALFVLRALAAQTLDRTVRDEPARPAGAKWRNRWVTAWSENPIVVRECWRRSSVPGGLPGYLLLRFFSVALPVGWILLIVENRDRLTFWGGAALLAFFYAARAAQRTLGAVVGEREMATWDTLAQTGLELRTFIVGWVQVGSFPVLLEAVIPAFFGLVLAWAFPAAVTPESWAQQASSFESMGLVVLGFLAGSALVLTSSLAGLALSASSRTLRQATGRGFGLLTKSVVAWFLCWGLASSALEVLAERGWFQLDSHLWETVLQVLMPMAIVALHCAWRARSSWRGIHAHLSLEDWPEVHEYRWGLAPSGGLIFFVAGVALAHNLSTAFGLILPGGAAGWLLEWWWSPVLRAWRGQWRVVGLSAALTAALASLPFAPKMMGALLGWPPPGVVLAGLDVFGVLTVALPLGALLGALCALPDLDRTPQPGGDFGRRTLVVLVLALLLHPVALKYIT